MAAGPEKAQASIYPDFVLDYDKSSVEVTGIGCTNDCSMTAGFTKSGEESLNFSSEGERISLRDLIKWQFAPGSSALGVFEIAVNMVFTAPELKGSTTEGVGVFGTILGLVTNGTIFWDNPRSLVSFDQGSKLVLWTQSEAFGIGSSATSDVFVKAKELVPLAAPSPAPVPPAVPAMLLVLGVLFYLGRRQRTGAALPA